MVALYRRRGYFQLTRDNIVAEADTSDIALMQLITDPFEQAEVIAQAAERRKQNPTAIISIQKRKPTDTSINIKDIYKQYYIGNIYYFPEMSELKDAIPDSLVNLSNNNIYFSDTAKEFITFYRYGLFHFHPLREHTYMRKGILYNEDNYFRTVNTLSQIGAWKSVDTRAVIRNDSVDMYYFLYPYPKQKH